MCNVEQAFQWSKEGIPKMADEEKQGRHPKWQKMSVKVTHAIFGYVAAWSDTQAEEKKRRICWITLIRYMLGLSRRMWWKDKRWLHARSEGGKGLKEKKETCKWVIPVFFSQFHDLYTTDEIIFKWQHVALDMYPLDCHQPWIRIQEYPFCSWHNIIPNTYLSFWSQKAQDLWK